MTNIYVADTETTVYDGQDHTEVWACGISELRSEHVEVFNNLSDLMWFMLRNGGVCYFHNLKFDGSFILQWLHKNKKFKHAIYKDGTLKDKYRLMTNEYIYSVSARGVFYSITIKTSHGYVQFYDSYKLLPFALEKIGKDFKTKHQKLEMEYKGYRKEYGTISPKEKEYLINDVLVLNEAMTIMIDEGHTKATIGSCCMAEYKNIVKNTERLYPWCGMSWDELFPNLKELILPNGENCDSWIRKSYRGGWCYCVEGKEGKLYKNGVTADVNSLYPFVMLVNEYPIGHPFYVNEYDKFKRMEEKNDRYYFIHFKCRFKIKDGFLPFIQIKNDLHYKGNEMLKSSKVEYKDEVFDTLVDMTMTMTDYIRFCEFYNVYNFEFIDACFFDKMPDLFTEYIEKYRKIKETSVGSCRVISKLFLNNLYGKMATSDDSSYKTYYIDDGVIKWHTVQENNKDVIYIPIGSAITSYARDYTIRHAQANYHGLNERGFIYADTDSLHCDLSEEELVDIEVHKTEFGKWDIEKRWEEGVFVRQKTYVEKEKKKKDIVVNVVYNGVKGSQKTFFTYTDVSITCAGMGKKAKMNVIHRFKKGESLLAFTHGLTVDGNLKFKQIKGGALLIEDSFEIK